MGKKQIYVAVPDNYRETEVVTFRKYGSKPHGNVQTLMFMLNPEKHEKFIPKTIFIPSNVKRSQWLKEDMFFDAEQLMLEVCSLISHETVHIALFKVAGRKACDRLDPIFGIVFRDSVRDVHGLLNLDANFRPCKRKAKGWGRGR